MICALMRLMRLGRALGALTPAEPGSAFGLAPSLAFGTALIEFGLFIDRELLVRVQRLVLKLALARCDPANVVENPVHPVDRAIDLRWLADDLQHMSLRHVR